MAKITYKQIEYKSKIYYGKHLMINASGCNDLLLCKDTVKQYIIRLCDTIDMQRYGDCHIHRFGHGDEMGLSAFQLIFTSNISMHTNDLNRDCYFDVFSCKDYDDKKIIESFISYFQPREVDHDLIYRE